MWFFLMLPVLEFLSASLVLCVCVDRFVSLCNISLQEKNFAIDLILFLDYHESDVTDAYSNDGKA